MHDPWSGRHIGRTGTISVRLAVRTETRRITKSAKLYLFSCRWFAPSQLQTTFRGTLARGLFELVHAGVAYVTLDQSGLLRVRCERTFIKI